MRAAILLALVASAAGMIDKAEMLKRINKYNWDVKCWGQGNMWAMYSAQDAALKACKGSGHLGYAATAPASTMPLYSQVQVPVALGAYQYPSMAYQYPAHSLGKREAHAPSHPHAYTAASSQQETTEFLQDWSMMRSDLGAQVGNLSCVLQQLNMLTPALQPNLAFITGGWWDTLDLSATLAGQDPEFRTNLNSHVTDCYNMANAMSPAALLRLDPLMNDVTVCRNMVFFKCAMKARTQCCAAAQLLDILELRYGKDDGNIDWSQYGLPRNKYELAAVSSWVLTQALDPVERIVDNFLRSDGTEI